MYYSRHLAARTAPQARFAMLPVDLLNDLRLSAEAVRTYGVLLDVARDGLAKISLRRIGERIGRQERTAEAIMRELKSTGWVEMVEDQNGRCRVYRLKTPAVHDGGLVPKTPAAECGGTEQTPAIDDTLPLHSAAKTPAVDCQLPIRSLNYFLEGARVEKKEDGERDDRLCLIDVFTKADVASPEDSADRLLRRWERPYERARLLANVTHVFTDERFAENDTATKIDIADEMTRRGEFATNSFTRVAS